MGQVTALEAKTRFGELLARVAKGEEIVITKYDRPVARIVPEGRNLAQVREAVDQLRQLSERISKRPGFVPFTDEEIRDAINFGRR